MIKPHFYRLSALVTTMLLVSEVSFAGGDALEEQSVPSQLAPHSVILDIGSTENLMIAVGERGHILRSTDNAQSWQQANVPVRVTLTSSYFVNDNAGWAVGHDGVVLRTRDGGNSWHKILDGYQANQLMYQLAKRRVTQHLANIENATGSERVELAAQLESLQYGEDDARIFIEEGAGRPLLDVWFNNEQEGFIVGALGLFLKTSDGGDSWVPWSDHIDNDDLFHLNTISKIGQQLFITGEAGALFVSKDLGQHWQTIDSPYQGSFFGVVGDQRFVIAHGLRGNAFISHDQGSSWQKIETKTDVSLFGSALLDSGNAIVVGGNGVILHIDDQGQLINKSHNANSLAISAVVSSNSHNITTAGFGGVKTLSLSRLLSRPFSTSPSSGQGAIK